MKDDDEIEEPFGVNMQPYGPQWTPALEAKLTGWKPHMMLDTLVHSGFRVELSSNAKSGFRWQLWSSPEAASMKQPNASVFLPEGRVIASGHARHFGHAMVSLGNTAAELWPDSWFAELWSGVSEEDKTAWSVDP